MESFILTPEQIKIANSALKEAEYQDGIGSPGVVIAQVTLMKSGNVKCCFEFIKSSKAKKIRAIMAKKGGSNV